jgi:hypothetical protein
MNIEEVLRKIAYTPNSPFLYHASKGVLFDLVSSVQKSKVQICEDEFAVYCKIKRGKPNKRLILITHLDHPGIVLKNSKQGIPFGSVGYERIKNRVLGSQIPIQVYDNFGNHKGLSYINKISFNRGTPVVSIRAECDVPPNSHGVWDVKKYLREDNLVKMINADNGAVTAVAIKLIQNSSVFEDVDLEIIFTYVEEVHQISSTGIALREKTPFGRIDKETIIINLEAMEMAATLDEIKIAESFGLLPPNYDNGLLIKVNDGGVVYGYSYEDSLNLGEVLLRRNALNLNIMHQYTISSGSTDAKSFSLFKLTPHVVTLAVPCKWKHNIGVDGDFVPEEFYFSDLMNAYTLLESVINDHSENSLGVVDYLSRKIKQVNYGLLPDEMNKLKNQRISIMKSVRPRMMRGKYYEENFTEFIEFNFWRVASKFV